MLGACDWVREICRALCSVEAGAGPWVWFATTRLRPWSANTARGPMQRIVSFSAFQPNVIEGGKMSLVNGNVTQSSSDSGLNVQHCFLKCLCIVVGNPAVRLSLVF